MKKNTARRKSVPTPAELRRIAALAKKAKAKYLHYEGVVGVGSGPLEQKGLLTGEWGIIVLVQKKLPKEKVPKGQLIPHKFADVRMDVREPRLTEEVYKEFLKKNGIELERYDDLPDTFIIDPYKVHLINLRRQKRITPEGMESPRESPQTAVFGEIFVIEDDGSIITNPGAGDEIVDHIEAFKVFRDEFGDDYDFLFFLHDTSSGMAGGGGAGPTVFNDITGISHYRGDACDDRAAWGSMRLQSYSYVHSLNIRHWLHETCHRWLAFANHQEGGAESQNLHRDLIDNSPVQGQYHWGNWFDDDDSCMDYDHFDWVDATGGYQQVNLTSGALAVDQFHLHPLDLYLMGMIRPDEVPAFRYVEDPTDDDADGIYQGVLHNVTVNDVIAVPNQGARNPACVDAQRVVHMAFIIITQNLAGVGDLTGGLVQDFNTYRLGLLQRFRKSTWGRGMIDGCLLHPNFSDIYIRDNAADTGEAESTGTTWNSPDVWVRNVDDDIEIHQDTIRGQSNFLRARIWNKSNQPYEDVTVRFYLGNTKDLVPGTTFYYPEDWQLDRLIGEDIINLPAGVPGAPSHAIAKVEWTQDMIPPAEGCHPCLLIEVLPTEITPNTRHPRWQNKKITQKNITIVDGPGDPEEGHVFSFAIGHTFDKPRANFLVIERVLDLPGLEIAIATERGQQRIVTDLCTVQRPHKPWSEPLMKLETKPSPPSIRGCDLGWIFIPRGTWLGFGSSENADCWKTVEITNDTTLKLGCGPKGVMHAPGHIYTLRDRTYQTLPGWYRTVLQVPGTKEGQQIVSANLRLAIPSIEGDRAYIRFMEYDENLKLIGGIDYEIRI